MENPTLRVWALFAISGGNLLWTIGFIASAFGEAPTTLHHWPEMAGLLSAAALGAGAAAFALVCAKNKRPYEICSAVALLAYAGAWLWLFGASLF